MVWPIIIGAALGAAKQYQDQKEADRQRQVQSQIARYSPWSGMKAESNVANPNAAANVGGGALGGWQMQQNMADSERQQMMYDKLFGGGNPNGETAAAGGVSGWQGLPADEVYDPNKQGGRRVAPGAANMS